jgi:hypothetical protein
MESNITCNINCNYRSVATVYTLEIWFVSGGGDYDDDDDGGGDGDGGGGDYDDNDD